MDMIAPVWVFPKGRKNTANLREYYRLVYNFNKVYPYALAAKELTREVDAHIAQNSLRRARKEKYINQMQKQLFEMYEKPLRNMTISQGKLLIKLVDRECNQSSYEIVKAFFGPAKAAFYQVFAWTFRASLKKEYKPETDDRLIERVVHQVESGQI